MVVTFLDMATDAHCSQFLSKSDGRLTIIEQSQNDCTAALQAVKRRKIQCDTNTVCVSSFERSQEPLKHKPPKFVNWTELPPELWVKIFGYVVDDEESAVPCLLDISKVCSIWRQVSHVPSIWTSLRFSARVIKKEKLFLKRLESFEYLASHCFKNVQDLLCIGLMKATTKIVSTVAKNSQALTSVSLQQAGKVSFKNCLQDLALHHGSTLREFSLLNTDISSFDLSKLIAGLGSTFRSLQIVNPEMPRCFLRTFSHLKNLTELKIECGDRFDLGCLKELHKLRVVHLINMQMMTKGVMEIEWPDLEDIDVHLDKLPITSASEAENRMVARVLATTENLRNVCFKNRRLELTSFVSFIMDNRRIESLDVSGFYERESGDLKLLLQVVGDSLKSLCLDNFIGLNVALAPCFSSLIFESLQLQFISVQNTNINLEVLQDLLAWGRDIEKIGLQCCRGLPRRLKRLWSNIPELRSLLA